MRIKSPVAMIILCIIILLITSLNAHADTGNNTNQEFTSTEKIEGIYKKTLVVGDDIDYPPYSFIDENGNPSGFNIDLMKAVAEVMGLQVEFRLGNWNEVRQDLESGKLDVISGMFYSEEREKTFSFTTKHTVTSGDIFTRNNIRITDLSDLEGVTVVVQTDDILHEFFKKQELEIQLIAVPTAVDALRLVAAGEYDYAAVLKIPGHYLIDNLKLSNLRANDLSITPQDYSMAVQKDNHDLLVTLNGGLQIVNATGKYQEIYDKWLGIYEKKNFWQEVLKYSWLIAVIFSIVIILIAWTFTLQRTVALRTKELVTANKNLQESKEKLLASYEEIEASLQELAATEEELRCHYVKLIESEKALAEEKELLRTTLLSVADGVIVTDLSGNIMMMNLVAERLTGWTEKEAITKTFAEVFQIIDEDTREQGENPVKRALDNVVIFELKNTALITKKGKERLIAYNVAPIKGKQDHINGAVLVFRDVTLERKNQRKIEYLSFHDQLTGLHNRRFFEEELKRLDVKRNLPLTIMMADVNGLKLINDSFGHTTGDELLKKVAEVLKKGCRADDIISRTGGDEFVILLPGIGVLEAEQIITRIKAMSSKEKVASIDLSISFGFETKQHEEEDILEIFKKAEDYMYKKKLFEGPSMRGKTIGAIINTLHEKNKREEEHSHRVSAYCSNMGEKLELPQDEINELKTVGLLHDIGKIAIEERILNKPGKLTDDEWDELRRHPEIGYRILSSVNDMAEMAEYVLAHHERWDGRGYPKGLKGEEIPLQSRIIAIADAYDAMISERAYRNALAKETAIKELQTNAGTQFDPKLVKVFIEKVARV